LQGIQRTKDNIYPNIDFSSNDGAREGLDKVTHYLNTLATVAQSMGDARTQLQWAKFYGDAAQACVYIKGGAGIAIDAITSYALKAAQEAAGVPGAAGPAAATYAAAKSLQLGYQSAIAYIDTVAEGGDYRTAMGVAWHTFLGGAAQTIKDVAFAKTTGDPIKDGMREQLKQLVGAAIAGISAADIAKQKGGTSFQQLNKALKAGGTSGVVDSLATALPENKYVRPEIMEAMKSLLGSAVTLGADSIL